MKTCLGAMPNAYGNSDDMSQSQAMQASTAIHLFMQQLLNLALKGSTKL